MELTIRLMNRFDREPIASLLSRIIGFNEADRAIAVELVDNYLDNPAQKDYEFFVGADDDGRVMGYTCYGPTPLTEGTFDLYWIAVDPAFAGQGVGTRLLKRVESEVLNKNGRLIVIETSSGPKYALTRRFYAKNGYVAAETIKDFYRPGEDRVTFLKKLR